MNLLAWPFVVVLLTTSLYLAREASNITVELDTHKYFMFQREKMKSRRLKCGLAAMLSLIAAIVVAFLSH